MTGTGQSAALQRKIWDTTNDVRGAVNGWDFKQYVLGTLFYRFISENFALYSKDGDKSIRYAELGDRLISPEIKDDAIKTKEYFDRRIGSDPAGVCPASLVKRIDTFSQPYRQATGDVGNVVRG
jgi:hypothetical protein